jgi:hypothetical protein
LFPWSDEWGSIATGLLVTVGTRTWLKDSLADSDLKGWEKSYWESWQGKEGMHYGIHGTPKSTIAEERGGFIWDRSVGLQTLSRANTAFNVHEKRARYSRFDEIRAQERARDKKEPLEERKQAFLWRDSTEDQEIYPAKQNLRDRIGVVIILIVVDFPVVPLVLIISNECFCTWELLMLWTQR